jgi:hypothetical protein
MPIKPSSDADTAAWFRRGEYVLIALLGLLYLALMGKYSAFELDNVWFLSFSHSFWVDHISTDGFMLSTFPSGMGGVVAFGKIAAFLQGSVLSVVGWSLTHAILISVFFTLFSLVLFAQTCRRLGFGANFTLCYIALLGFSEPFVALSQRARYEFLMVFLMAVALWLAARQRPALAVFAAALAMEIEPVGVVVVLATATFLFSAEVRDRSLRPSQLIFSVLAGMVAALAVYFLIHPGILSVLRSADWIAFRKRPAPWPGGFVAAYYFAYRRHLPELAVVLVAGVVSLMPDKRYLLRQWPALCVGVVAVAGALLRWPNAEYFCLIAPFLCLFVLQVFYADRYRNVILAVVVLATVPQYAWRYRIWSSQHAALSQHDQREVSAAIDRAAALVGRAPEELNIVGNYTVWFAHPHRFINLNRLIVTPAMLRGADLILCFDQPVNPPSTQDISCSELNSSDYAEVGSMKLRAQQLHLLRHVRER